MASAWGTRQTVFAREMEPARPGYPTHGESAVGAVGADWTWLRIAVRRDGTTESSTASTSRDGIVWARGGTWTHALGEAARIGLVAMGGTGWTVEFDDLVVRTSGP